MIALPSDFGEHLNVQHFKTYPHDPYFSGGLTVYGNYQKVELVENFEAQKELMEDLENMEQVNMQNSVKQMEVLGATMMVDSMGSYDAIAELNKAIDKSMGGYREMADPAGALV